MDLFINTLTGTTFELRVTPFEAILNIKLKIQRNEGIPVSQQHLIWQSIELEDDFCLHDYSIKSGATLTLVLAMRDGPINMRRVSVEEPSLQEVAEYMDANRDEVWDKLMNDDKQVTLLVFRDGEQLNFFRVYDRGDGVLSPYSDTISAGSSYHMSENANKVVEKDRQVENEITKNKMLSLKHKFSENRSKQVRQPRPPSAPKPVSRSLKKRPVFQSNRSSSLKSDDAHTRESTIGFRSEQSISQASNPAVLPPVKLKDRRSVELEYADQMSNHSDDRLTSSSPLSNIAECNFEYPTLNQHNLSSAKLNAYTRLSNIANVSPSSRLKSREKSRDTIKTSRRAVLKPLGALDKMSASGLLSGLKSPPKESPRIRERTALPDINSERNDMHVSDRVNESSDYDQYKNLLDWVQPKSSNFRPSVNTANIRSHKNLIDTYNTKSVNHKKSPEGRNSSRTISTKIHPHGNYLPPVVRSSDTKRLPPTLTGKKRSRCSVCAKKLGLATTYQCRCANKFCATHRYPETHTCSYDYKSEGRKLLEKNNPVVNAPKLPKI